MKQTRTYEWTRPQDIAAAIDGLSGADVAKAMAEGRVPAAPVADLIGVTAFEAARGRVVVGFDPQEYHYNALGTVHGGVIATLIDTAEARVIDRNDRLFATATSTLMTFRLPAARPEADQA